jgi:hypothetical protein
MDQVVVMGDLNETLSRFDRLPLPPPLSAAAALAAANSPIRCLQAEGFTDAYRALFPIEERNPGFAHVIGGLRPSSSRIDYIWSKGFSADSHLRVIIDSSLHALSHHRLLWAMLKLHHPPAAPCNTPLLRLQLPNLRAATEEHKESFVAKVEEAVHLKLAELDSLARADSTDALDHLATSLTALVRRAAFSSFPITGAASYKSNNILELQNQRRDLTRLLQISEATLSRIPAKATPPGDCFLRCMPRMASPKSTMSPAPCLAVAQRPLARR